MTDEFRNHDTYVSPTRWSWYSLIARCYNKNNASYPRYGAKGIQVCERWRSSYDNFVEDMGARPDGCTIGRIDNKGNYEPSNCRWMTREEQDRNKRNNRFITAFGETKCITDWATQYGLSYDTLYRRLNRGLAIEEALIRPLNKSQSRKKLHKHNR